MRTFPIQSPDRSTIGEVFGNGKIATRPFDEVRRPAVTGARGAANFLLRHPEASAVRDLEISRAAAEGSPPEGAHEIWPTFGFHVDNPSAPASLVFVSKGERRSLARAILARALDDVKRKGDSRRYWQENSEGLLFSFDLKLQKMRRAGNAGIVGADEGLASKLGFQMRPVQQAREQQPQVGLDPGQVLGSRRHNPGLLDQTIRTHIIAVIEQPTRRFADRCPAP